MFKLSHNNDLMNFVWQLLNYCVAIIPDTQRSENGTERVIDPGTAFSIDIAMGRKRKIHQMATTTNDDSDDDDNVVPPANDLYRSRQQKKVK